MCWKYAIVFCMLIGLWHLQSKAKKWEGPWYFSQALSLHVPVVFLLSFEEGLLRFEKKN